MKNNKLATAVMIATLAVSAQTMAADWFVGGSIGYGFNDIKSTAGSNLKDPDSPIKYDLRAGAYINDNARIYGSYSYGNDDASHNSVKNELTEQQFLISADYIFGSGAIKPFVGVSLGATNSEFEVSGSNGFKDDDTSFALGGQVGLLYKASSWDFELGYRHIWHDNEIRQNNIKLENTNSGVIYGAVNYRF